MVNMKSFYFIIGFAFCSSANAMAFITTYLSNQVQLQIERNYKRAMNEAGIDKQPLISHLAKSSQLNWQGLVDLGFYNDSFTAKDAQWAIENFHSKQNQTMLNLMLKYPDMELLVTESINDQGNLLVFCLQNGYDDAFSQIRAQFPIIEANRHVSEFQNTIGAPFRRALQEKVSFPTTTLLENLLLNNHESSYKKLVKYGLMANKFTNRDLLWIIKEHEKPEKLAKAVADSIFRLIFDPTIDQQQKDFVFFLLQKVDISKESSYVTQVKPWLHSHSHSELHNVLVQCIEDGHLKAFKEILEAFPELINNLSTFISVQRQEYHKKEGWFGAYQSVSYNFIDWLLRSRGGEKHIYIKEPHAKAHYMDACKAIYSIFMANYDQDNPQAEIDSKLFELVTVLTRQNKKVNDQLNESYLDAEIEVGPHFFGSIDEIDEIDSQDKLNCDKLNESKQE